MSDVNPHYLDHVVKLSETSDIEASEDIVTGTGMKLLAKGTKIDARARERLLQFRLTKPLENMMRVVGGTDPASFGDVAERLLARHQLLDELCKAARGFDPVKALRGPDLSPSVQSLLSVYAGQSQSKLEHAVGVALLTVALGGELSAAPAATNTLAVAGLVHDVGELYIDPKLLTRKDKLSPQEWKHIATHPIVGSHVLGAMPGAGPRVAAVVLAHHEREDGFGYPQGTPGSSLSQAGQTLAVAEMLMGIMESARDNAGGCAAIAMRLVPGEFGRRLVDRVAQVVRDARLAAPSVEKAPTAAELRPQVGAMSLAIRRVRALRGKLGPEIPKFDIALRTLHMHAFERWERIAIAFASAGLELDDDAPLDELDAFGRAEAWQVLRELNWRITELERQLAIRAELLVPGEARRMEELIELTKRPVAEELAAA